MELSQLLHPKKPWLHLLVATAAQARAGLDALTPPGSGKVVVRVIRGTRSATRGELFNEIGAALQFPDYFGDNWDALDESLADLEWLPADAYVLLFTDAHHLLEKEPPDQWHILVQILEKVGQEWSTPRKGTRARPAKAFHAVFQCTPDNEGALRDRLQTARASYNDL